MATPAHTAAAADSAEAPAPPPRRAEEELPALYAAQGLRVPVPVMLSAMFVVWLASERAPLALQLGWLGAVALVLVVRGWVIRDAARASQRPIMQRMNAIAAVAALGGLVHGQSVLFWPYMDQLERAVQSMFVLGLCAGAVATEFGHLRVFVAYMLPLLVPLALAWARALAPAGTAWYSGPSGVLLLLVAMYGALLTVLARDTFGLFRESFESRQRMRRALEHAEAANRAKTRFLASASHDLRQPMHTLSLFAAALTMRPLDPVTRDIAAQLNLALQALSSQLDALLDISKLDAGVVPVEPRAFALLGLLARLREEFGPVAARKGLELRMQLHDAGACHSDPLLLERVLRNLLDNAIKYTPAGRVALDVGRAGPMYVLTISDTGPGIPVAEQQMVFEEFYQLGNPERDRAQGLGLGLAIVRRLADLLQLDLRLHSLPGQGTTFTLTVPAAAAAAPVPGSDAPTLPSIRGLRVLVIDDEEAVREGMRTLLQALGAEVSVAAGSDDALALARRQPPHVVLADFRLRGGDDGLAAVRRLREQCPGLPALLVSGDTAPQRLREAHAAGLRLLHKPAGVEVLTRAIREEVDHGRGTDPADGHAPAGTAAGLDLGRAGDAGREPAAHRRSAGG